MTRSSPPRERVLVVGYGYAGKRFAASIDYLQDSGTPLDLVGICDRRPDRLAGLDVASFDDLDSALAAVKPTIVCVTVNERAHLEVFEVLGRWTTPLLVLAEKPLAVDVRQAERAQVVLSGHQFAMNMVERFSPVTAHCRSWLDGQRPYNVVRVESFWGKNRIGDPRPTMGVLSELIHPLDLARVLFASGELVGAAGIGTHSDLSPWADATLDSLSVMAYIERVPVVLHSSFVWSRRMRTLSSVISTQEGLHRVELAFDDPKWDCDRLDISRIGSGGRLVPVYTHTVDVTDLPDAIRGVGKVTTFVKRSLTSWQSGRPDPSLVDIDEALALQRDLDVIEASVTTTIDAGGYRPAGCTALTGLGAVS